MQWRASVVAVHIIMNLCVVAAPTIPAPLIAVGEMTR